MIRFYFQLSSYNSARYLTLDKVYNFILIENINSKISLKLNSSFSFLIYILLNRDAFIIYY